MIDIPFLIRQKKRKVGNTRFLSIDGHGGSGKSTLANMLAPSMNAVIIRTDDFASLDNAEWSSKVLHSVFQPMESGETTLSYQRSKWWPDHQPEPVVNQKISDIMILEGVGSSQIRFRKYLSLSLYVDTPTSICLQRGIARDRKANAGAEEEIEGHWKQWIQEEKRYFKSDKPKQFADFIVNGTVPFAQQIKGLAMSTQNEKS